MSFGGRKDQNNEKNARERGKKFKQHHEKELGPALL